MERLFTFLLKLLNITKAKSEPENTVELSGALYTTPEESKDGGQDMPKIYTGDETIELEWDKVETYVDTPKWAIPEGNYKKVSSRRKVNNIVVHWDGCLDSEMCHRVITNRGLSVHFCIDTDGTIIQLMNTNDIAWHARGVNTQSIGIEVANPVY